MLIGHWLPSFVKWLFMFFAHLVNVLFTVLLSDSKKIYLIFYLFVGVLYIFWAHVYKYSVLSLKLAFSHSC